MPLFGYFTGRSTQTAAPVASEQVPRANPSAVTINQFLAGMRGSPWFEALDGEEKTWFRREAKRSLSEGKTQLDAILNGYVYVSTMQLMQGKMKPNIGFVAEDILKECLDTACTMTAEQIQEVLQDFHSRFDSRPVSFADGYPYTF